MDEFRDHSLHLCCLINVYLLSYNIVLSELLFVGKVRELLVLDQSMYLESVLPIVRVGRAV